MKRTFTIGQALPEKVVTNDDLVALFPDWTPQKILAKTGIASRHVADGGETALDLAVAACEDLFCQGMDRAAVDYVLFCTQSPVCRLPGSAGLLQHALGLPTSVGALDYNLGCSGFVYGLSLAKGLIAGGSAKKVLLVTAETYSKYLAADDRSTRSIFGDGATATLVDADLADRIGAFVFGTDGGGAEKLIVRNGEPLFMDGPEIFNFTLDVVPPTVDEICRRNGLARGEIDLFVFHQANRFMLDTIRQVCALPEERFYVSLEDVGNTVSSTIPIALRRAEDEGRLRPGMTVMLLGFGVGLSWAGTIVRT